MLILHSFWLSMATYRVRIALHLKGVAFEERTHDLQTTALSTRRAPYPRWKAQRACR